MCFADADAAHKKQAAIHRRVLHRKAHCAASRPRLRVVLRLIISEMKTVVALRQPNIFELSVLRTPLAAIAYAGAFAPYDLHARSMALRAFVRRDIAVIMVGQI